jgi:hypothetical protein
MRTVDMSTMRMPASGPAAGGVVRLRVVFLFGIVIGLDGPPSG